MGQISIKASRPSNNLLEAVSVIPTEYYVDKWVYSAVHAGKKQRQEWKCWSSAERVAEQHDHRDDFHGKPEQREGKDCYDEHLKNVLFGFELDLLIGCSYLPWNLSHPYFVYDGAVKKDDFQQG